MLSRDAISMKASEFENIAEDSVLRHDGNTNGEQLFILYDRFPKGKIVTPLQRVYLLCKSTCYN